MRTFFRNICDLRDVIFLECLEVIVAVTGTSAQPLQGAIDN